MAGFAAIGILGPEVRKLGGDCLGHLCELRLAHLGEDPDFAGIAFMEGRAVLHARHVPAVCRQLNLTEAELDAAFCTLIEWALQITAKVCAGERAFLAN